MVEADEMRVLQEVSMDNLADAACMAKLHTMAALLDIPVESFFTNDEAADRFDKANECLRLWDRIKTADGRRRALECLRELANEPVK
ncbi:hypothetical protein [Methylobacterium sp. J-077]|uniref:hypothetical protein n=1 Tax=Methylobacterium sp. J-077 TaxID=2836656 RepID=UPI001FB89581|nr:hypothetical protein [Methylobacterium sp. J-077]MCJ2121098.1 hypothetical protein [Methylobacterium sp. J-077]